MASEEKEALRLGIIGMGEMGRVYARRISVCDRPENFVSLAQELGHLYTVREKAALVARECDFMMYATEVEALEKVVAEAGPATKYGAIVSGQCSVKSPEKEAFQRYLPEDTHIISLHSLHGPRVSTEGQGLIVIPFRTNAEKLAQLERIVSSLKSKIIYMDYDAHDAVTANTQAVTHAAFLSMGAAWMGMGCYPWETGRYVGGIEVVKINIMMRIYSAKWHVYAGLAIRNPQARIQIKQYATSVTHIMRLMCTGDEQGLRDRLYKAREYVFGNEDRPPIILISDAQFDEFAIGHRDPTKKYPANSHLSILAMVDSWYQLKINPYKHLDLAATPIFRLLIGVTEYVFRSQERLDMAIHAGATDQSHRVDDIEFLASARIWSEYVGLGSFEGYKRRFEEVHSFFQSRMKEGNILGDAMIQRVLRK